LPLNGGQISIFSFPLALSAFKGNDPQLNTKGLELAIALTLFIMSAWSCGSSRNRLDFRPAPSCDSPNVTILPQGRPRSALLPRQPTLPDARNAPKPQVFALQISIPRIRFGDGCNQHYSFESRSVL
jgi:hypothetical protein